MKPRQTAQDARSAPEQGEVGHRHRYAFPTPTTGSTYVVGVCPCGAESRGLAFETTAYEELKKHGRRGKG